MTEKVLPLGEERFYDLLSFMVTSAFMLSYAEQDDELYPSLRLMDGANRLTKAVIDSGGFEGETWPQEFVARCEAGMNLLMTDEEAFLEFLGESTRMLATEMKSRAATR
jgi:hypothetical protein